MVRFSLIGFLLLIILASAATTSNAADDGARLQRIKAMTVSDFMAECRSSPAQCAEDAGAADEELQFQSFNRLLTPKYTTGKNDYCEPENLTHAQVRDVLTAYFTGRPRLTAGPLLTGAQEAFSETWASVCDANDKASQQKVAQLTRMTSAEFLADCRTDLKSCDWRTLNVSEEVNDRQFAAVLKQDKDFQFCSPDLELDGLRKALVGYLTAHPELASTSFLTASERAFIALWPNKGQC
jgi:hypothetical protein